MPTSNQYIDAAINRGVKKVTLQDAVKKLRRARKGNDHEFEIALGELWATASEYFRARNEAILKAQDLEFKYKKLLEEECSRLRKNPIDRDYGD